MRHLVKIFMALACLFPANLMAGDRYSTHLLAYDGIHDPNGEAIHVLQEPGEAMADFPFAFDRHSGTDRIDWVKTRQADKVKPRGNLSGDETMMELDMDIPMKQTAMMPYVRFPHLAHTQWLDCANCHPGIFIPRFEANPVTMEKIFKGEFCGACHGKVAFGLLACERCHSVQNEQFQDPRAEPPPKKKRWGLLGF